MLGEKQRSVLERIARETESGRLKWIKDVDGYFVAPIGSHNQKLLIRQMYLEATNQIGADPYFIELSMPLWNARFAITDDSEGWYLIRRILTAAFPADWHRDADQALAYLDAQLSEPNI